MHSVRLFPFTPFNSIFHLASSPPLCPTLSDVTTDSLVVSWYPPNTPRGIITDYEVRRGEGILSTQDTQSSTFIALFYHNICKNCASFHSFTTCKLMYILSDSIGTVCADSLLFPTDKWVHHNNVLIFNCTDFPEWSKTL